MRRRNKEDKRVLRGRPNNNRNNKRNKPLIQRNRNSSLPVRQNRKQKRKTNKTVLILMIIALIAFVIGAGIGVSISLDEDVEDETPQYENVTVEMTSNLNETEPVYFDSDDDIDYNNQSDISQFNLSNQTLNY